MKTNHIAATILCVQTCLAVPHGASNQNQHQHLHKKRDIFTTYSIVTNVVTVTDYDAVVWVDYAGNVVKTDHHTTTTTTPTSSSTSPVLSTTTTSPTIQLSITSSTEARRLPTSSAGVFASQVQNSMNSVATLASSNVASAVGPAPSPSPSQDIQHSTNKAANIAGFGVDYDPWSYGGCRTTIDSDFAWLASKGATSIRVYDNCFGETANAAAAYGIKLMIGLTTFDNFDPKIYALAWHLNNSTLGWSVVHTVFIGNELVNKNIESAQNVADQVTYARGILRQQGFEGDVITVDTWTAMRDNPTICSTSDYCAANAHAFFDGNVYPENAGQFVRMAQNQIATENPGKRIVISESGWPHAGDPFGVSIASVENQRTAMNSITQEFSGDPADMYLFMAFDAKYKATLTEQSFGIFDADHYDGAP